MTSSISGGRTVAVLVVLAVVATVAFGPSMATIAGDVLAPAEPEAGESLVLEPHPGPNGKYAVINAEDELEIVGADVTPGIQSSFEDVFTITNNASRTVEVGISHGAEDDVVFDSNGSSTFGAIQTADGIEIPANETVAVGFHVDSTDAAAGDSLLDTITFQASWVPVESGETEPSATDSFSGGSTTATETDTSSVTDTPTATDTSSVTDTPTETPSPTETDGGTGTPVGQGSVTETPTPTPTPTETDTTGSPSESPDSPQEIAGISDALLWLVVVLLLAGGATFAYRRFA